ncbi:MAG TPA: hypothetical protein VNX28_03770 [Gemmataceae bacterium]|nr:hypothetical protein [Gemmataceae bacterium]
MSPNARTLITLRRRGLIAWPVERWIAQRGIRVDVWSFGDILAADPRERRILLVQATSVSHVAERVAKIQRTPEAAIWLKAGGVIEVWGWAQVRGKWHPKIVSLRPGDLAPDVIARPPRRGRSRHKQGADLFGSLI